MSLERRSERRVEACPMSQEEEEEEEEEEQARWLGDRGEAWTRHEGRMTRKRRC